MSNLSRNIKPSITSPLPEVNNLAQVTGQVKEVLEVMTGQRGDPEDQVVTWRHLLQLGLVKPWQVPK